MQAGTSPVYVQLSFQSLRGFGGGVMPVEFRTQVAAIRVSIPERVWGVCDAQYQAVHRRRNRFNP